MTYKVKIVATIHLMKS